MKVLICDPTDPKAIEAMRSAGIDIDVRDDISADDLLIAISNYEGIVVRGRTKVRQSLIDAAINLKAIVRGGVGLDNIDVEYAKSKGITVMNTPAASSISVAELSISYMFALARRIPQATASMKAGLWEKKKFKGTEIYGKVLGIIGIGRIGREVAKRAVALGMKVIAYDPWVKEAENAEMVSLDDLLGRSDYITLHLPLTEETRHLIDRDAFGKMKDGIRIIDCARGGILDEDALYDAIAGGKVAGAGLDVYTEEPSKGNKLFELDQVIGSPHVGAATKEAQARVGAEVAEKMIAFSRENC